MSDEEALIDGALLLRGEEGPRVLRAWSVMIGEDQIEQLNDLAREARDRGWDPQSSAWRLMREAIDEWIPAEHRRRAERDERERDSKATEIERQIEALMGQLRALRDEVAVATAPAVPPTTALHQPPLPLPARRRGPLDGKRMNATRDVLALLLREKRSVPTSLVVREVYGRPGLANERKAQKRLRALEREELVIRLKHESAEGHGLVWKLTRAGEVMAREMLQAHPPDEK